MTPPDSTPEPPVDQDQSEPGCLLSGPEDYQVKKIDGSFDDDRGCLKFLLHCEKNENQPQLLKMCLNI